VLEHLRSALSAQEGVAWAYVFGSLARGEAHRDVDVAIMPREGAFQDALELGRLQAALQGTVSCHVDLVDLRGAPLPLIGSLLADRQVLIDRAPADRHAWEADSMLRWIDFRPTYERASAIRREALQLRYGGGFEPSPRGRDGAREGAR
jgi:uncharacterized protein